MMGWINAILASDQARKVLGLLLAAIAIALSLLNLHHTGERTGSMAERLATSEKTHEIQRQMLDAAALRSAAPYREPVRTGALADGGHSLCASGP